MEDTPVKTCTKCGATHPATTEFFSKLARGKYGLGSWCKPCRKTYAQSLYKKPEYAQKIRENTLRWRQSSAFTERREDYIARHQAYKRRNPNKIRQYDHKRRAAKRNAGGSFTAAEIQLKFQQQKGRCYWCSKLLDSADYHVDHIIALAKGGSNGPENICCACVSCNLSKNAKTPWDFAGRLL